MDDIDYAYECLDLITQKKVSRSLLYKNFQVIPGTKTISGYEGNYPNSTVVFPPGSTGLMTPGLNQLIADSTSSITTLEIPTSFQYIWTPYGSFPSSIDTIIYYGTMEQWLEMEKSVFMQNWNANNSNIIVSATDGDLLNGKEVI